MTVSIRCRFGVHKWQRIGYAGLFLDSLLYRCGRCGAGKCSLMFGQAVLRYTPEQMKQLMEFAEGQTA